MNSALVCTLGLVVLSLGACATGSGGYVGAWRYDRQSLRPLAMESAYESVAKGETEELSPRERAELERWVNENHDSWDKRLEVRDDGTFVARSQVAEGRPEFIEGTWSAKGGRIEFVERDGEVMATGRREGGNLVLEMTDDEGTTGRMVLLPAEGQAQ